MALSFRRQRDESDAPTVLREHPVNGHVVRELERAAAKRLTGAVRVEDRRSGNVARIHVYAGQPYSVVIDGLEPAVLARLVSAGALTGEQRAELGSGSHVGPAAVARGWVDAERLGSVHQELMLAGFGAAATCAGAHVAWEPDVVTDRFCTLPVEVTPLMETVPVRAQRLAGTWQTLAPHTDPATAVFLPTGSPVPESLDKPEFRALLGALAPSVGLDEAARRSGFTRAEAVHLTGMLVAAGVAALVAGEHGRLDASVLSVPEEFAERGLQQVEGVRSLREAADDDAGRRGDARAEVHATARMTAEERNALLDEHDQAQRLLDDALDAERAAVLRVARAREELGRIAALLEGESAATDS